MFFFHCFPFSRHYSVAGMLLGSGRMLVGVVNLASFHMPFVFHNIPSVFVSGGGPISSAASLLSNSFTSPSACVALSAYCTILSANHDPSSYIALYAPPVPYPSCPIVVPTFAASIFSYSSIKCVLNSIHCWQMVLSLRFQFSVTIAYSPPVFDSLISP